MVRDQKLLWNRSELSWIHQSCSVDLIVIAGLVDVSELSLEGLLLDVDFFGGEPIGLYSPQEVTFVVEMRFEF